ncbi:hypothetical protein Pla123a_21630 [Posidoniimonas polymericola]|uniref:DUF58 domain-containing protein n=1 Tax=Posidoniimonas polymericola TaxID=2528002 RepID=A0A5C5YRC7_9BACT|nr:DUF58 domain-containing protein [Posidoniimonas polymericola]TWT77502.1 hypothetical protein Pla123a_21630 [Posidoniimonas polymericola]
MPTPPTSRRFLDPAVLAKLKGLRLRAEHIVEGYVAGLHRSPFQGFSIEFAEHREYAPGDDLRFVDWKVFGKTDRVYLKQYEEETNLIAYLVLDQSESMTYQSAAPASNESRRRQPADGAPATAAPMSKLEYAQTAAAALAYLVLHQQDAVGLATFDDRVRRVMRPSSSPATLNQLLLEMERVDAREKTATGPIFHDLAERLSRRGVVFIFSDLFDDVDSMLAGLKHFRHRRHDVVVCHVLDPAELDFPFDQPTLFKGLEGAGEILADPARLREAYRTEFEAFTTAVATGCRTQGADYLQLRTDQPLDAVLHRFLAARQQRVR